MGKNSRFRIANLTTHITIIIGNVKFNVSAEEKAKNIFSKIDENSDGRINEEEFLRNCLKDEEICRMLVPNATN